MDSEVFDRFIKYMYLLHRCKIETTSYVNVNLAGDIDSRKSDTGFVFCIYSGWYSYILSFKSTKDCCSIYYKS